MANKNAIIRNRETRNGKLRTETARRDEGSTNFTASTDPKSNTTSVFVNTGTSTVRLSGNEARTLYRLLRKHYEYTDKSTW